MFDIRRFSCLISGYDRTHTEKNLHCKHLIAELNFTSSSGFNFTIRNI